MSLVENMKAFIKKEEEAHEHIRGWTRADKEAQNMWHNFVRSCTSLYFDEENHRLCSHYDNDNGLCNVSFHCPYYTKLKTSMVKKREK